MSSPLLWFPRRLVCGAGASGGPRRGTARFVKANSACGLAFRIDHGAQHLPHRFRKQIRFPGIAPSSAFLDHAQINGVAERFVRTLKEQPIYAGAFRTFADVKEAVGAVAQTYNRHWAIERNDFLSPIGARARYQLK